MAQQKRIVIEICIKLKPDLTASELHNWDVPVVLVFVVEASMNAEERDLAMPYISFQMKAGVSDSVREGVWREFDSGESQIET